MSKFTRFEIHNFKGIKHITFDLAHERGQKVFTLVGLNESGKTTILEAIDFFQRTVPTEEKHTLIPKSKKTNFNDKVYVKATILLDDADEKKIEAFLKENKVNLCRKIQEFTLEKYYQFKNSRFEKEGTFWNIKIIAKRGSKTSELKGENWQKAIAFIRDNVLPPIVYYPNFLFSFPPRIYLDNNAQDAKEQVFYRRVVQDILDSIGEGLNIQEHLLERLPSTSSADRESLEAVINKMGSAITDRVFKSWDKIFKPTSKQKSRSQQREIKISTGRDIEAEGGRYYLEIKLKHGSEQYSINELSLGLKWFFSFLLFTEFRKSRSDDNGEILFLLDEPASNLHSTAQSKLLETIQELVNESKLIYTTHSHHLISPRWLEGAFIVQNKALDYSNIDIGEYDVSKTDVALTPYRQFVQANPGQNSYFKPILDSLDYQPSHLELVPNIVIVEGKNDFYTLSYFKDIILNRDEFSGLKFYPGNGAGKNDQIVRLYIAWGKDLLVINDDDEAGRKAIQKYRDEIGPVIDGKQFTLRDIDGSWDGFSTENLFTEIDKNLILSQIFPKDPAFSKEKFNSAINYLLTLRKKVELEKTTKERFTLLFEFILKKMRTL